MIYQPPENGYYSLLPQRSLIQIQGPEADKLLQGQATSNMNQLTQWQWAYSALCTPKGRVYANFKLAQAQPSHYWLAMHSSLTEPSLAKLQRYAAFFDCALSSHAKWKVYGLCTQDRSALAADLSISHLPEPNQMMPWQEGFLLAIDSQHYELWCSPEVTPSFSTLPCQTTHTEPQWPLFEIQQAIHWLCIDQAEQHTPQAIGWVAAGGISFDKGCYTGQEVIARLHYRGKSKRQLKRFTSQTRPTPSSQTNQLFNDKGLPVADVLTLARSDTAHYGLAIIADRDAAASLFLDSAQSCAVTLLP